MKSSSMMEPWVNVSGRNHRKRSVHAAVCVRQFACVFHVANNQASVDSRSCGHPHQNTSPHTCELSPLPKYLHGNGEADPVDWFAVRFTQLYSLSTNVK